MKKIDPGTTLKRLRNRYRLVIMNDDTYEEVVTVRLSRRRVYIGVSIIFVLLVGLTAGIIVFTPIKYYIPGYGSVRVSREYRQLKYLTDSLSKQVSFQAQYIEGIRKVMAGEAELIMDTTQLQLPQIEISTD